MIKKKPSEEQKTLARELIKKARDIVNQMKTEEGKKEAQRLLDTLKVRLFEKTAIVPMERRFEIFLQEAKRLKHEGRQEEAEKMLYEAKVILNRLMLPPMPKKESEKLRKQWARAEEIVKELEGEYETDEEDED